MFLQPLAKAQEDNDQILGCIAGSAVAQNNSSTPMFAPNADSLAALFSTVVDQAAVSPRDIAHVEAHGVGTRVGDPAEYEAINQVLGGETIRDTPLCVSSVKGLVGHTECAAGAVSLVKTLLMMHRGMIPAQGSFDILNPDLGAKASDMLQVPMRPVQWKPDFRATLVNSYGASGSNAAMIITRTANQRTTVPPSGHSSAKIHPFCISGLDERAVQEYAAKLASFVHRNEVNVADVSFSLDRQSDHTLPRKAILSASGRVELPQQLDSVMRGATSTSIGTGAAKRKVILCFGR